MRPEAREELIIRLKLTAREYAKYFGATEICREFNIPRSTFYRWKLTYEQEGSAGLHRKKPIAYHHPGKTAPEGAGRMLELRSICQIGGLPIAFYLDRYHGIKLSEATVARVLRADGVSKLARYAPKRALHSRRNAKTVPGHHVQVDVKFLQLKDKAGKIVKRYQYTAIDDATRIRALQIFSNHNQECAIQFIDDVIEKFPFRISTVRTDRGHEFQARFHCHVEDQGLQHVYIKPRIPQLNRKVERSHRTDETEFYQLLTYTDDVDLSSKLEAWENFYKYDRPHMSLAGKTPYEVMRSLLK